MSVNDLERGDNCILMRFTKEPDWKLLQTPVVTAINWREPTTRDNTAWGNQHVWYWHFRWKRRELRHFFCNGKKQCRKQQSTEGVKDKMKKQMQTELLNLSLREEVEKIALISIYLHLCPPPPLPPLHWCSHDWGLASQCILEHSFWFWCRYVTSLSPMRLISGIIFVSLKLKWK